MSIGGTKSPIAPGDFKSDLLERLKVLDYARGYLTAALDEAATSGNWDVLTLAMQDVIDAHTKRKVSIGEIADILTKPWQKKTDGGA